MNSLNRVVLMGYLGSNPKSKATVSGKKLTYFTIATNEFIKETDGKKTRITNWHKVSTWGKIAETCEKVLQKGSLVLVEGKIRSNSEHSKTYEVFATDVSFISNYDNNNKAET